MGSQHGQDIWLDEHIFDRKRDGVFVEIGAMDGLCDSNSLFFERERNWRGVLVEANPYFSDALRRNRPLAGIIIAAVYNHWGTVSFEIADTHLGWSGIRAEIEPQHRAGMGPTRTVTVDCIPLVAVIGGIKRVDYLSIDVEGAEPAILRDFPFGEFDIDIIGVENNYDRPETGDILGTAGYSKIHRIGSDDFYRRC